MSNVTIFGCGWLGAPLGAALAAEGRTVKGTTTTASKLPQLAEAGIVPLLADIEKDLSEETLLRISSSDEVVVTLPFSRKKTDRENIRWFEKLARTLAFEDVQRVVMISSTAVYPEDIAVAFEEDAMQDHALYQCERFFLDHIPSCAVIRFAGLMGPGRHPGKFYAGKKDVPGPLAPVNFIHLEDCIGVIRDVLERKAEGVFNACALTHPDRKTFYTLASKQLGLDPPAFDESDASTGRSISSARLMEEVGYVFKHEDIIQALDYCL